MPKSKLAPRPSPLSAATLGVVWTLAAVAAAIFTAVWLDCAIPVFTVVFLAVALASLVRHRDGRRVGIAPVDLRPLARVTLLATVISAALIAAVEPWSGTFERLVGEALAADPLDTTFGWLVRFEGARAWTGFILFGGLVAFFAEELFFRGWLLQLLLRNTSAAHAVLAQAALFALLQTIVAFQLPPLQAILYVGVFAFAGGGIVGGWAAWRTASIWPSLVIATAFNAVLTYLVR